MSAATWSLSYTSQAVSSNTVVVDKDNAYWATGDGYLRAVALATGTLAWAQTTAGVVNGQIKLPSGVWNAPVLAGSYLVVPCEASLYVFNKLSGAAVERLNLGSAPLGPLALSGTTTQPMLTMILADQSLGRLDLEASLSQGGPVWISLVRLPGIATYIPGGASLSVSPGATAYLPSYNGTLQAWLSGPSGWAQQFKWSAPLLGAGFRAWCVTDATDVFVADTQGRVSRLDPSSGGVSATSPVLGLVDGLALDALGKHLFVAYDTGGGAALAEYDFSLHQIWSDLFPARAWLSQPLLLSSQVVDVLSGSPYYALVAVALDNSVQTSLTVPLQAQSGAGLAAADGRLVLAASNTGLEWWTETAPTPVLRGSWVNNGSGASMVQLAWTVPGAGVKPFSYLIARRASGGGAFVSLTLTSTLYYNDNPSTAPGSYLYRLTLTDGGGLTSTAQVLVTVGSGVPGTATPTSTWTTTATVTACPTASPSFTPSASWTASATDTPDETPTTSSSPSPTSSPTDSDTSTPSPTQTISTAPTATLIVTPASLFYVTDQGPVVNEGFSVPGIAGMTLSSFTTQPASNIFSTVTTYDNFFGVYTTLTTTTITLNGLDNCIAASAPSNPAAAAVSCTFAPGIYQIGTTPQSYYSYNQTGGVDYLSNLFAFGESPESIGPIVEARTPGPRLARAPNVTLINTLGYQQNYPSETWYGGMQSCYVAIDRFTTFYFFIPAYWTCGGGAWNMQIQVNQLTVGVPAALAPTAIPPKPVYKVLVVAGGGAGGDCNGGGGGGGGVLLLPNETAMNVQSVTVGGGGVSYGNGGNSAYGELTALGGGAGGGEGGSVCAQSGGSGGGGGNGLQDLTGIGQCAQGAASLTLSWYGVEGYRGGNGKNWGNDVQAGGGGGGGGGPGCEGGCGAGTGDGGYGGIGFTSSISGRLTYYSGGGGGGSAVTYPPGMGGLGGGGHGGAASLDQAISGFGSAGTFFGGGGGGASLCQGTGGNGYQGAVIISFPDSYGSSALATGGYTVTNDGTNTVYTFTQPGTFWPLWVSAQSPLLGPPLPGTATASPTDTPTTTACPTLTPAPMFQVLVVAGGGAGGICNGGGGGGGGVISTLSLSLTTQSVGIGAGGMGTNGGDSYYGAIVAFGGGVGGSGVASGPGSGGSGGGGGNGTGSGMYAAGAAGTSGQGYSGGTGHNGGVGDPGGGGGGAGGKGYNYYDGGGGMGGPGYASSISGSNNVYGGGGGGGTSWCGNGNCPGGAGQGGGGWGGGDAGANASNAGSYGGGGGGGGDNNGCGTDGSGYQGVVIISFPQSYGPAAATGAFTQTSANGDTIYTFTGDGTFSPQGVYSAPEGPTPGPTPTCSATASPTPIYTPNPMAPALYGFMEVGNTAINSNPYQNMNNGTVYAMLSYGNYEIVGGSFDTVTVYNDNCYACNTTYYSTNNLAAFNTVTGVLDTSFPQTDGPVYSLASVGSDIVVGGSFNWVTASAGVGVSNLFELDGNFQLASAFVPPLIQHSKVYSMAVSGGTIYIGGSFQTLNGSSRNNAAAIDAVSGKALPWNPDVSGPVYALTVGAGGVYLGGNFNQIGTSSILNLGLVDGITGTPTAWFKQGTDATVRTLLAVGGAVYVGGDFNQVAGQSHAYLAALHDGGPSQQLLNWYPYPDGPVDALAFNAGILYLGGGFQYLGGQSAQGIGAVNVSDASPLNWNPDVNGPVYSVQASASSVHFGGNFSLVNGQPVNDAAGVAAPPPLPTSTPPKATPRSNQINGALMPWLNGVIAVPNPAANLTDIFAKLLQPGSVEIRVYDLLGRTVITKDLGYQVSGVVCVQVDTQPWATGVYFVTARVKGIPNGSLGIFKLAVLR